MAQRLDRGRRHRPGLEPYAAGLDRLLRPAGPATAGHPAGARRLPPRPDAAHADRLEDHRLRGRAGQDPGRAAGPGQRLARRRRHAALVRLRRGQRARARQRPAGRPSAGAAFLDGYAGGAARARPTRPSLRAYEADKAIYEVVYEVRNRPDWVPSRSARSRHSPTRAAQTTDRTGVTTDDHSIPTGWTDRRGPDRVPRGPRHRVLAAARRAARSPSPTTSAARSSAPASRSGRRTPRPSGWSATSTAGTARTPTCTWCRAPGSGPCSSRASSTGSLYKFEVLGVDGVWRHKADPMARFTEAAPHTASIVYDSQYAWDDDQWMWYRGEKKQHAEPMSIYEVHIGSWRKGLTYLELADQLVEYVHLAGLHPRRVHAGRPAPVRGVVGLPRHRLLRPDVASSAPPTSSATWSTSCTRPASA